MNLLDNYGKYYYWRAFSLSWWAPFITAINGKPPPLHKKKSNKEKNARKRRLPPFLILVFFSFPENYCLNNNKFKPFFHFFFGETRKWAWSTFCSGLTPFARNMTNTTSKSSGLSMPHPTMPLPTSTLRLSPKLKSLFGSASSVFPSFISSTIFLCL